MGLFNGEISTFNYQIHPPMKNMHFILMLAICVICHTVNAQSAPEKIPLASGGYVLDGYFYHAGAVSKPTVILLHGLPGNNQSPLDLAQNLNQAGMNILVFNYRGSYTSDGYFSHFHCMEDLDAAITWLKQPPIITQYGIDTGRIVVCGYSFGGGVVLWEAIKNPAIKNIITIAGLDQSVSLKEMAADTLMQVAFAQRAMGMFVPAGPLKSDPQFSYREQISQMIARADEFDVVTHAEKLKDRNILFIGGSLDNLVPMEIHLQPLYQRLMFLGAEHITLQTFNTGHRFNEVRPELAKAIGDWVMGAQP